MTSMRKCKCKIDKIFPKLDKFLNSPSNSCLKRTLCIIYGIALGIGLYNLILVDLDFTPYSAVLATFCFCILFGLGAAFSIQFRCISFLTLPVFGSKVGRGIMKTLVLAYLISGPVENIAMNGKEVVRVFACSAALTFNLTKTRFELMFKPFSQAILQMKADVNEVKDTLRSIKDVSAPIVGEVEDETEMRKMKEENDYIDKTLDDSSRSKEIDSKYRTKGEMVEAQRYEKLYLKKIETRCENQFSKAAKNCRGMFEKAYDSCYDAVTWAAAWLLCWPMKLNFICNIAEALGGSDRCDPSKEIDPGFGEGYAYLKKSRSKFAEGFKNVKIQYKINKLKDLIDFRDTRDSAKAVWHTVKEKKKIMDQFFTIMKRILAFVFLKLVLGAQKYHDQYLREIEFDNTYVTSYFRRIDARRKAAEKKFLLPLKKLEKRKLVDPCSIVPLKNEIRIIIAQSLRMLIEIFMATSLILLDRLFYEALDLIRRHGKIEYTQTGHHDMKLEVKGTGMIANLLRSVVRGFNVKKRIRIERTNAHCLPRPNLLPKYYLYKIYGIYLIIWLLLFLQAYIQRIQRFICALIYPKREKKRILYLYNETLKRRVGFFRFMKKKIQKLVREHRLEQDFNVCTILRIRYPKCCGFLRIFRQSRRQCLTCKEVETSKFTQCDTCHFVYCHECWIDIGTACLVCKADDGTSSGIDESSDGGDDVD